MPSSGMRTRKVSRPHVPLGSSHRVGGALHSGRRGGSQERRRHREWISSPAPRSASAARASVRDLRGRKRGRRRDGALRPAALCGKRLLQDHPRIHGGPVDEAVEQRLRAPSGEPVVVLHGVFLGTTPTTGTGLGRGNRSPAGVGGNPPGFDTPVCTGTLLHATARTAATPTRSASKQSQNCTAKQPDGNTPLLATR